MKKRVGLTGALVLALVFGLAIVGCDDGSTSRDSDTDSSLNGTWISGSGASSLETKFDNGDMVSSVGGTLMTKGSYTTANGKITSWVTAFHGDYLDGWNPSAAVTSRWYSKNEVKTILGGGMSAEDIEDMFSAYTSTYSVKGTTLTIINEGGGVTTYTRK